MCWPKRKLPTNQEGQATRLWICHCQAIQIRTFHISWFTFFLCFFGWFATANLWVQIQADLGLSDQVRAIAGGCAVGSTVLFRVIFGYLCDAIGSKKSYVILLIMSAVPIICMALVTTAAGYIIVSFFIGMVGSSFVITQYHVMQMFAGKTVGTATATATGWGNFGGGCANFIMPLFYLHFVEVYDLSSTAAWRIAILVPGLFIFLMSIMYWCCTDDLPPKPKYHPVAASVSSGLELKGTSGSELIGIHLRGTQVNVVNMGKLEVAGEDLDIKPISKPPPKGEDISGLKVGALDYRTWILSVVYAACFGIELSVLQFTAGYFMYEFNVDQELAGLIVLCFSFSNLFARSIGGIIADVVHQFAEKSLTGRVYALFIVLVWEGVFLLLFSFGDKITWGLGYTIIMMVLFSLGVQAAEGITFAIVPFVQPEAIGPVAGIVAAGGNVGAMLFAFAIFTSVPSNLSYFYAWLILAIFVLLSAVSVLFIKFSDEEIKAADAKAGSWTNLNEVQKEKTTMEKLCPFI